MCLIGRSGSTFGRTCYADLADDDVDHCITEAADISASSLAIPAIATVK